MIGLLELGLLYHGYKSYKDTKKTYKAYEQYKDAISEANLENLNTKEYIDRIYGDGYISEQERNKYINLIDEYEKMYRNGHGLDDLWTGYWNSGKQNKQMRELYDTLYKYVPEVRNETYKALDKLPDDIKGSFYSSIPDIEGAPTPNDYMSNPNFQGERMRIDPVHLYSGQEMADLHDINYDVNHYYDQIKQGTEANVDLGHYQSRQLQNASMVDDTKNQTEYLDAIRGTKSEAIANGMTAGGRAAAELLNNKDTLQAYSDNQANVFDQRFNAVDNYLLADAQAKLNARDYFNQLAQALSTDAMSYYASDTERQGGQYKADSTMYTADQDLRGTMYYANGQIAGAYAQGQAAINAARSGMQNRADEYAWVYDRFLGANGYNTAISDIDKQRAINQTNEDMDKYLLGRYSGTGSYIDIMNAQNNKK